MLPLGVVPGDGLADDELFAAVAPGSTDPVPLPGAGAAAGP
jgi:hypothetical protein